MEEEDGFVFVFDRRSSDAPEVKISTGGLFTFKEFKDRVQQALGIGKNEKFVITTTNREEIKDDATWDIIDKGDTLYVLNSTDEELCAPAEERVNYLPHYDTIVKGGMYEYYASEGQNPLPYAFAELIDNALAATAKNVGPRNIEIRLHFDENQMFVIDNGKGMTSRQLNNWAIYRLSKFIRKDKRSKVNLDDTVEQEESFLDRDLPKSLNSDISYFGVGGKQAIFFIGDSTRMISRPRGSKDVHELTISREEFEKKEKNHESIYSGVIRNRKPGDASHIPSEEETLRRLIEEEPGHPESFTAVVIQGISKEHMLYLKERLKEWTRQLAHIYHYYLHGPNGNLDPDENEDCRVPTPFKNIEIQVKVWLTRTQQVPRTISLRDIDDDMQSLFVRHTRSSFEFKAHIEGAVVEGVIRYHPFLYDRETYPTDVYIKAPTTFEDEHDYAISDIPARGRRAIFECFWNGRLIPYTLIDSFEWCSTPKKIKSVPIECYNRVSGVLWTDDSFQVSTNKLTFIDLELRLRDKMATFTRIINGQEKRTSIEKEFTGWLKECHELHDKQIHFTQFAGSLVRNDLPKNKQTPWCSFKQFEWDGRVFRVGQMVRIARTLPTVLGTIQKVLLYGDYTGDVYATGGDLEIVQEPRSLYTEVKIFPLSRLDRFASAGLIRKCIEEEEAKLPSELEITWPEGNAVQNNEKRRAGKTIGDLRVEILNRKGDKISKMPGKDNASKKLLVELKVILHASTGDQVIVSHVCQHGKNWPFWFRKMENIHQLGAYTLQLQVVLNESGESMLDGKPLPCKKIHFQVTEAEPETFSVTSLLGPFRVGVPFNITVDLQDTFGNQAKPSNNIYTPKLESRSHGGMDLHYASTSVKGHSLIIKEVTALAQVPTNTGKTFSINITIPELNSATQTVKVKMLPGPAASLSVSPEEEMVLPNGQCPKFRVQIQDPAGNPTALEGRQSVVCKLSGASGLPSYSTECSSSGGGVLTGDAILLKKMKSEVVLTAKFDVQGTKTIETVERKIKLVPSGRVSEIRVFYQEPAMKQAKLITGGMEIVLAAGEQLEQLTFRLYDEAETEIPVDEKMVPRIKVNWIAKVPRDQVLKGCLPSIKAPTSITEHKYCQVSVADSTALDVGFVLKTVASEPNQLRCSCMGSSQIHIGQPFNSEIHVHVKDRFGNTIVHESDKVLKELNVSGEGLKEDRFKVTFLDARKNVMVLKGLVFEGGTIGRKEVQVMWKQLKDYVRLEMVAGPPATLSILHFPVDEPVVVFNESSLPHPFLVQLLDIGGNPCRVADVRVQLAKDAKLKLIPNPVPVKTSKEGIADFGAFIISSTRGLSEIQPKAYINSGFVISGPKLKVMVQADPTRPSRIEVTYNTKAPFVVGENMPEFTVKMYAEDDSLLLGAKSSSISLKLWKSEGAHMDTLPNKTIVFPPDPVKKAEQGTFYFREAKTPVDTGSYSIMFVYYDGKHQVFSNVIHIKADPGAPVSLVAVDPPGTATVSNTRNLATRCVVRNLKLELRDKYGNHVTKGMNGGVDLTIRSVNKGKELPLFVGEKSTVSQSLAGGTCHIQQLALMENSPGEDGCEYELECTVLCRAIPKSSSLVYHIPFLFYNDVEKQSAMAELSKERDGLQTAIKTYKALFETTEQLIEELKSSVKEAKAEETKIKNDLRKHSINVSQLTSVESIDTMLKDLQKTKEEILAEKRRTCSLASIMDGDPEVLGKIGQLALIAEDDAARVLSWHMSSDMDCVVTMTTKKAKEIYRQTNGKQQVLPLDSIFRKTLTDWNKPLPHQKQRPNWMPPGNLVYARHLLTFSQNVDKCQTVFSMLLGDTLMIDTLDQANDYRKELVKFTNCPTILTREGDRIRSNGKFGGLMNKAPPIDRLKGAVFGAPVSQRFQTMSQSVDMLQNLRSAIVAHQTAEEELADQVEAMNAPEMKAKYEECREVEKQLQALEKKLGVVSNRVVPATAPRDNRRASNQMEEGPAVKRARSSTDNNSTSSNGVASSASFTTPVRQSRRIASMTPDSGGSGRKKLKK